MDLDLPTIAAIVLVSLVIIGFMWALSPPYVKVEVDMASESIDPSDPSDPGDPGDPSDPIEYIPSSVVLTDQYPPTRGYFKVRKVNDPERPGAPDLLGMLRNDSHGLALGDMTNACEDAYLMGEKERLTFEAWAPNPMRAFYNLDDPTKCDMRRIVDKREHGYRISGNHWVNGNVKPGMLGVGVDCETVSQLKPWKGPVVGCFEYRTGDVKHIHAFRENATTQYIYERTTETNPKISKALTIYKGGQGSYPNAEGVAMFRPMAFYSVKDPSRCEVHQVRADMGPIEIDGKWTVLEDGEEVNIRASCDTMADVVG
jgi:hypothetical protein